MTVQLNVVGIVTSDMAASLAFYRLLGVDIPAGAEAEPHVQVALGGGVSLAWDTVEVVRSFEPDWAPPTGGHRIALAFGCDDAAGVDGLCAKLEAAGATVRSRPWDAVWGQRYAVVLDPDGATIELFAPLG